MDVRNEAGGAVLSVDLGKTTCTARFEVDGRIVGSARVGGAPGLSHKRGVNAALEALTAAFKEIGSAAGTRADVLAPSAVGVGAAGAAAAPAEARKLAELLRARFRADVSVCSDAIAAHAGAFGGCSGTLLIAGTGACAVNLSQSGKVRQIDGWGPLLGDAGSGQWIGRMGFDAALRAHDGRGPATALERCAEVHINGALESLPLWLAQGPSAQMLGSFAPEVLRAAADDEVARAIAHDAAAELADTARAGGVDDVCVVGGLIDHPLFVALLSEALSSAELTQREVRGSPLDGAALIASNPDTVYESHVERVQRPYGSLPDSAVRTAGAPDG